MVHGCIWLLGLYFELFPHNNNNNNNNNNCYQALTCAGAAGKKLKSVDLHGKCSLMTDLVQGEKFKIETYELDKAC